MSEMICSDPVYAPAFFPEKGRLSFDEQAVWDNHYKQAAEAEQYSQQLNVARGFRGGSICARALHISLFFDGTNNNEAYDTNRASPPHPTNVARLYHASIDNPDVGYFGFYIPGVGTPFPEIGEMDYGTLGMATGYRGEDRINWGLLRVVDALLYALNNKQRLEMMDARVKLREMSTLWPMAVLGRNSRRQAIFSLLAPLRDKVTIAQPKVLAIKLFIYGFSRGAAEARTFVTWLSELFDTPADAELPEQSLLGIPLSIEFLGVLDTVASVGVARVTPMAEGHMDWADGTQGLPDEARFPGWIKQALHGVAAHEQRLCFPLDSIRYANGRYPSYAKEVVYPGVHSDVGGGYPHGEQGKARGTPGELVSQIVLHDMYAAAFAAGAPLLVSEAVVPKALQQIPPSRTFDAAVRDEFKVSEQLVTRFNHWRTTLGLDTPPTAEPQANTGPLRLSHPLETVMADQMAWLTGWRIDRFARGTYANQPFYGQAKQTNAATAEKEKAANKEAKDALKDLRKALLGQENATERMLALTGSPGYEPAIDQQQLREAAVEFEHDYLGKWRPQTGWGGWVLDVPLKSMVYLLNDDDEQEEYRQLKVAGERYAAQMFYEHPANSGTYHVSTRPELAAVVALFDDQVHDSRAWFLHDSLKSREAWGEYMRYRMVYFGTHSNKRLTPAVVAGRVVGIGLVVGGVYSIRRHGWMGLAGTLGAASIGYEVVNRGTDLVVPFLPGAAELLKPTNAIGEVVVQQRQAMQAAEDELRMQNMLAYLKGVGSLAETAKTVKEQLS